MGCEYSSGISKIPTGITGLKECLKLERVKTQ